MVRGGEIFLKGLNRNLFFKRLYRNLERKGVGKIIKFSSKFLVLSDDDKALKTTFGISNYSKVITCKFDKINETALSLIKGTGSFCVRVKRTDKVLKKSSEIEREVGAYIVSKKGLKVNLSKPDQTVFIDLIKDTAYLFNEKIQGLGGLPVGCEGVVSIDVKNEKLSTVAGYLLMKRGCSIIVTKDLPLLHAFDKVKVGSLTDFVVVDDVEVKEREGFVLRPLIGYNSKEIEEIYEKIKELGLFVTKD